MCDAKTVTETKYHRRNLINAKIRSAGLLPENTIADNDPDNPDRRESAASTPNHNQSNEEISNSAKAVKDKV